jgi:hypothetical protein
MTTQVRSTKPKCPDCGFSIFNRRFAKCESCGKQLPTSIVYTADELKALAEKDKADDEAQQKARHRNQTGSSGSNSDWLGGTDGGVGFDFSD